MSTTEQTKIEWAHYTFNPWRGCTKVSAGCKNCYAETLSGRNPKVLGIWGPRGKRAICAESYWSNLRKWNEAAKAAGERRRVFCASLADMGEGPETMPDDDWLPVQEARRRMQVEFEKCDWLERLILSKRPENLPKLFDAGFLAGSWVGTSVENQATADERIPHMLKCPAAVRFLSCEPLLGAVDLTSWIGGIDWVIVGCESGPSRRDMQSQWARDIAAQCKSSGVAFFMKQMIINGKVSGAVLDFPPHLRIHQFPGEAK